MPAATRRVAVMFDADELDRRQRETLRGAARYAQAARWHLVMDPYAAHREPGRHDGIIATAHRRRARSFARSPAPIVCVNWSLRQQPLTRVVENRYAAGRVAALHLVERG